jgi:5S rRNA maturation endonuclease (ribonuclease M5)
VIKQEKSPTAANQQGLEQRTINNIVSRLQKVRKTGPGKYQALCPAHPDKNPSLSITEAADGKLLYYCHAGCSQEAVEQALGIEKQQGNNWVAEFAYHHTDGNPAFYVKRDTNKNFYPVQLDGTFGYNGTKRLLYELHKLINAPLDELILIVEGEKDVKTAQSLGYTATTNPGGANSWKKEYGFNEYFRGRQVVVIADNDEKGLKHAHNIANQLQGIASSVKVIEKLPGVLDKGDLSDWVNAGGTREEFLSLVENTPEWSPEAKAKSDVGILMSDVEAEAVEWLSQQRVARGKITMIDGDPGNGKSTLTADLAGCVSIGLVWPERVIKTEPAGVVFVSAEDGLADTTKPRLEAAGADCSRILALTMATDENGEERPITLPGDLNLIRQAIERVGAKLVIIDPLMAFLGGETNSHKDQDIRRMLYPVAKLAEDTGAAFIVVRHLNKSSGGNALYRGGGSIGIIGAARSGFLVDKDPNDDRGRVFACVKSNLAEKPESLSFHLEDCGGAARVVWDGVSPHTADALLAVSSDEEKGALREAEEILSDILASGPVQANEATRRAREAGVSERTLRRARKGLGVLSRKAGGPGTPWVWELPKVATSPNPSNLGHLKEFGHLNSSDVTPEVAILDEKPKGGQGFNNSSDGHLKADDRLLSVEEVAEMFDAEILPPGELPF